MATRLRNRHRRIPFGKITGSTQNLSAVGPYVTDVKRGVLIEQRFAVMTKDGWVSSRLRDGSWDRDDQTPGRRGR